ncbi:STAS domain-containing protein [Mycobacterium celatum]|uniref:STAS domain-containing protein n=1 Tax=Mycobacterium celatum TaxID=28045 RepID=A0A1X1RVJ1_MYCCE|nr:STAS domain-containing protein [Mycobacterium celatum]ORV18495.1 sulfate transporter [Mycobacterium celatum]PIB80789.1 STAS domain-containing protein [Mycobacterium celatum]
MTESLGTSGADFTPRYGSPVIDCGGAQVRAQCRHLATVVTISGAIDAMNVERVSEYCRHFVLSDKPIVLDLSGVDCLASEGIRLLYRIDDDCRTAGVEWALVASPAVTRVLQITNEEGLFPVAESVHEALHYFADAISARRRLLMPLLNKTA